jgi:hypothetical protein
MTCKLKLHPTILQPLNAFFVDMYQEIPSEMISFVEAKAVADEVGLSLIIKALQELANSNSWKTSLAVPQPALIAKY